MGITVFTVNGGAERAGRVTQAPTDTGAVCLQRHLWQVRTLHGHSPRPGLRPRRAALPASLPCRSHLWDQRAWDPVGHSRTLPLPHLQVWASHLGAGSQRKAVQSQSQEHPWRGDPIHAEAEGSSRRCRCSWWLEDLSACPLCGLT